MKFSSSLAHRAIGGLGIAAVAALILSGCSITGAAPKGGADGGDTGTVNALFMKQAGYSESDIAAMINDFEKTNPKITVKPTFVAYEALHDKIVAAAPAGTYDVVLIDVIWPAEFGTKGIVADVSEQVPATLEEQMLGGAVARRSTTASTTACRGSRPRSCSSSTLPCCAKAGATPAELETWDGVLAGATEAEGGGRGQVPADLVLAAGRGPDLRLRPAPGRLRRQLPDAAGKPAFNTAAACRPSSSWADASRTA